MTGHHVHETVFSCKVGIQRFVIPMADVQHVLAEDWSYEDKRKTYTVVTKHTVQKNGVYQNAITLQDFMGKKFMRAWMGYRHDFDQMLPPYEETEPKETKMDMDTFLTTLVDDMSFETVKGWAEILAVQITEPATDDEYPDWQDGVRVEVAEAMGKVGK